MNPLTCFHTLILVCPQFLALGRGYLYFWMNVWDAVVLTVAVTLAVDRLDSAVYVVGGINSLEVFVSSLLPVCDDDCRSF